MADFHFYVTKCESLLFKKPSASHRETFFLWISSALSFQKSNITLSQQTEREKERNGEEEEDDDYNDDDDDDGGGDNDDAAFPSGVTGCVEPSHAAVIHHHRAAVPVTSTPGAADEDTAEVYLFIGVTRPPSHARL